MAAIGSGICPQLQLCAPALSVRLLKLGDAFVAGEGSRIIGACAFVQVPSPAVSHEAHEVTLQPQMRHPKLCTHFRFACDTNQTCKPALEHKSKTCFTCSSTRAMPGHTLDEAAAQAVKQSATATAAAASAKADGTGGGAAAADDHAQLQERLAGYCIGALTSNLIALGEK